MPRKKIVGIVVASILIGLAGCATAPSLRNFPYPVEQIKGAPYFALVNMCERENIAWDYDPLSQVIILKKDNKDVRLLVNSDRAVVDKTSQRLSGPVLIRESVIYAPVDVRGYFQPAVCPVPGVPGTAYLRPVNTIVLDPGHGGKDPGATGRYGLREKDVVLDVAERVKRALQRCG